MIKKTINIREYAEMPNPGLLAYLNSLKVGQPDVYEQPFYKGMSGNKLVSAWSQVLFNSPNLSKMPGLRAIEAHQREKVGPYSVVPPLRKRLPDLFDFYRLSPAKARPLDRDAIRQVQSLFKAKLTPCSVANVLANTDMTTNSGLPYFVKRRKAAEIYARNQWQQEVPFMAIAGTRVQPGGMSIKDEKVRFVWMFPMLLNVREQQYYHSVIAYQQRFLTKHFSVNKLRDTEVAITTLFDGKPADQLVINTDFTKFDQHFNKEMQRAACDILTDLFVPQAQDAIDGWFWEKFRIPILISDTEALFGDHGMGSGSGGTNPDENLAHKALQFEAAMRNGQELADGSSCLGDDGVLSFKDITVDKVTSVYTSHGLEMNPSKQYADAHSTYYLQRYYHDSFRDSKGIMLGVYSTERALGRLRWQERFYDADLWSKEAVIYRALQIIENCNNHPCFYEFVDFCKKGDKYGLGTLLPGFFDNIDKDVAEHQATFGQDSYTVQNEETGASQWRVVRYLKNGEKDF